MDIHAHSSACADHINKRQFSSFRITVPGKTVMQRGETCCRQAYEVLRESKENVYHSQWHILEDSVVSRMHCCHKFGSSLCEYTHSQRSHVQPQHVVLSPESGEAGPNIHIYYGIAQSPDEVRCKTVFCFYQTNQNHLNPTTQWKENSQLSMHGIFLCIENQRVSLCSSMATTSLRVLWRAPLHTALKTT